MNAATAATFLTSEMLPVHHLPTVNSEEKGNYSEKGVHAMKKIFSGAFKSGALAVMFLTATTIWGQQSKPAQASMLNDADKSFMSEAAVGGMAEVELGRLAARKGNRADVKAFGQRMVTDHSKANSELKRLASHKGMSLPAALTDDLKAEKTKLEALSGADFDREYMSMMADDHDKDVAAFQSQATNASDPDLKAFVTKTLPTLQEHQRMAHDIKAKM
jgi:predicted outer membrane protein